MVDLNGHEAGNGGHSQGKPTAYRDSSTRREGDLTNEASKDGYRKCGHNRFLAADVKGPLCRDQCKNAKFKPEVNANSFCFFPTGGLVTYVSVILFCQPSHRLIRVTVPKLKLVR